MATVEKRRKRKRAERSLIELSVHPENVLVIHYSCESFYDRPNGRTPRITSIAIRNFQSGQTYSFSIHKVAEIQGIQSTEIAAHYDALERVMLDEYFVFLREHRTHQWVHWNMRDINYGFQAIEHRYRVLGGEPTEIDESRKTDIARSLVAIHGDGYIPHPHLLQLVKKNEITDLGLLPGAEEAKAFEEHEFVKLHQSTLRKVDAISDILARYIDGTLRTEASWWRVHAPDFVLLLEAIARHWIVALIALLASAITILAFFTDLFRHAP